MSNHETPSTNQKPGLGKLGKSAAKNEDKPSKMDKGVKNSCEGKSHDIMSDSAMGKVKVDPKKPKLGDFGSKYPKDTK